MSLILVLPYYIIWHYSLALSDMIRIWKDFFVFIFNFFSIENLLSSLFSPWQRLQENYSEKFSLEGTIGTIVLNTTMRIVGAVVRLIFITIGIISLFLCFCLGVIAFCLWFLLPFILVFIALNGITLLLS